MRDCDKEFFEILGIEPTDSSALIQRAYRRQIRRWHPDRFSSGSAEQRDAEEMTKQLNRAYDCLRNRHSRDAATAPAVDPAPEPAATHDTASSPQNKFGQTMLRPVLMVGMLALVYWLWLMPADDENTPPFPVMTDDVAFDDATSKQNVSGHYDHIATIPLGNKASQSQRIIVGSSAADVMRLLGPPLAANPHVWEYGPSRIYFKDGLVTGWYDSPYRALPVR